MTNRERVISAIKHNKPDYTPHYASFTEEMLAKMITHTGNVNYIDTINNHITVKKLSKPKLPVQGLNECVVDEFGVIWDRSGVDKDVGVAAVYKIKDIKQLEEYFPPPVDEEFVHNQCKRLVEEKEDNFAVVNFSFSLFERAWTLCGMEDLLCYMLTDPEAVYGLFSKLTERNKEKAKIVLEYDIDGLMFGDDWGQQKGMIMGRPLWVKLIKPHLSDIYGFIKSKGRYVIQHSCGDISEIFDDLIEIGLDVYQTFQPEIYDLHKYKEKFSDNLTIWGAISTQADLPFKSPDEIYELTKNTIKILGNNGGYIAAPTHDIPPDVPPENIEAMVRAFKDR